MYFEGNTILEVWKKSIVALTQCKEIVPTDRNLDTYELRNAVLNIQAPLDGLNELLAYEKQRGIDYNSMKIKNYWKNVNDRFRKYPKSSVYQFEKVKEKLVDSPYMRHGFLTAWSPTIDLDNTYPLCLIGVQFLIRDDKLNMTAILRSNDSWGQALNDMYQLVRIQETMANELQIAVGEYTHFALSYHLYTKDYWDASQLGL